MRLNYRDTKGIITLDCNNKYFKHREGSYIWIKKILSPFMRQSQKMYMDFERLRLFTRGTWKSFMKTSISRRRGQLIQKKNMSR